MGGGVGRRPPHPTPSGAGGLLWLLTLPRPTTTNHGVVVSIICQSAGAEWR